MTIKKLAAVMGVLALVAVIASLAVSTVFAQTATPPDQTTPATPRARAWGGMGIGMGGFGFWGGGSTAAFDATANALGLTPTQLFEQLHSGKTLSEIAQAQGVDLQKVQDAVKAVQTQALKDRIAQAVKDGKMTQAQADWLLQGIENGYMNGGGGFGGRFGGHMRGGMRLPGGKAPTATPAPGASS